MNNQAERDYWPECDTEITPYRPVLSISPEGDDKLLICEIVGGIPQPVRVRAGWDVAEAKAWIRNRYINPVIVED